jgi:hypothetical protein
MLFASRGRRCLDVYFQALAIILAQRRAVLGCFSMWVSVVVKARSLKLGSRGLVFSAFAVFAVSVLGLGACGRAAPKPHPGTPGDAGRSGASGEQNGGEGGIEDGTAGAVGGSGGASGRGTGGTPSGGGAGKGGGGMGGAGPTEGGASGGPGGIGGNSPLANLPLPADCQPISGAGTELLCNLDVTCGGVAQAMSCYHTSSGAWQCTCEPPNSNRMYLIEGAVGLDACAVGAGLCAGPLPTPAVDAESCVVTRDELGTDNQAGVVPRQTCTLETQCRTPVVVDFAPGVMVTMPGAATTHCVESPTQEERTTQQLRMDCDTVGSLGERSHEIIARSVAAACRPVLDFYLTSREPVFDGSKSCIGEGSEWGTPESCRLTETCFDSAPMSDDVSVVKNPSARSTICGYDDLDNLSCLCRFGSIEGDIISYDLGAIPRPLTCDLSKCTPDMRAEPTGSGVCQAQLYSGENDDDTCTDSFSCRQPATLAGQEVTLSSWLRVRCARAEDDAFYCGCAVGEDTATFRAGNMPSVDACAMARTECLEHVTLPVVPASGDTLAPDPLLDL